MPWNVVRFTAAEADGSEGAGVFFRRCFGLHRAVVLQGRNRPEIAVLTDKQADSSGESFYFSPEASALYEGLLRQFNAKECERPDKVSVSLLIGSSTNRTDSWQSLFPEKG